MQKRFWKRYWWLILVVAIASYYYYVNRGSGTISSRETSFAVSCTDCIDEVVISTDTANLVLTRNDKGWKVNGTYPARHESVEALMLVLKRLRTTAPIPISVSDSLTGAITRYGKRVMVKAGRRALKEYYVHYTEANNLQSIGMLKGSKGAYQLKLPNFRGDISALFRMSSSYWRANQLGVTSIEALSRVDVETPANPAGSFSVNFGSDGQLALTSLHLNQPVENFDATNLNSFLSNLTALQSDQPADDISHAQWQEVVDSGPEFVFTFYYNDGSTETMTTYPVPVEVYTDELGRTINYDLNNIYVVQPNDSTLYQVKYIDFHPVLKDISNFIPKNL